MKRIFEIITVFLLLVFVAGSAQAKGKSEYGNSNMGSGPQAAEESAPLDVRIEQWVNKTCGQDAVCADKKRTHYKERMKKYNERVQKKCGDDAACRQGMRAKYMERRAKREQRISTHCGDDEACRDKLREQYSERMEQGRNKCGDDKACWKAFYKENKPNKQ